MTDMAMRLHVADEDVPIFTFSPPVIVPAAMSEGVTFVFSAPIKVSQRFTGVAVLAPFRPKLIQIFCIWRLKKELVQKSHDHLNCLSQ